MLDDKRQNKTEVELDEDPEVEQHIDVEQHD